MNPKKKKVDNFDSCRDLSGRRLRSVYNEQRLEEWSQRQQEEEKYVQEENKEYDKKKKELQSAIHANNFKLDEKYKLQVQKGASQIADGVKTILNKKREAKLETKLKKKGLDMADLLKESDNEENIMPERTRKRIRLEETELEVK